MPYIHIDPDTEPYRKYCPNIYDGLSSLSWKDPSSLKNSKNILCTPSYEFMRTTTAGVSLAKKRIFCLGSDRTEFYRLATSFHFGQNPDDYPKIYTPKVTEAYKYATSAAEFCIGLIFAAHRRLPRLTTLGPELTSRFTAPEPLYPLSELALGVIGCGKIGSYALNNIAHIFEDSYVYDPKLNKIAPSDDLGTVIQECSLIVIAADAPGVILNKELLDEWISYHKQPILVNIAGDHLVDMNHILDCLHQGVIWSYATDNWNSVTYGTRPTPPTGADLQLIRSGRLIITPHAGGGTHSDRKNVITEFLAYVHKTITEDRGL